jgi:hypothetical protein
MALYITGGFQSPDIVMKDANGDEVPLKTTMKSPLKTKNYSGRITTRRICRSCRKKRECTCSAMATALGSSTWARPQASSAA